MANCMIKLLKNNGVIIIEVQYFPLMLKDLTFDNIYHEHVNYWSLISLTYFFSNLNCKIFKCELIDTHGGSLRIYISKNQNIKIQRSVKNQIAFEKKIGLSSDTFYKNFEGKIVNIKNINIKNLEFLKKKYKRIVGYGAPAKASTALNYFGINNDTIKNIIDDNYLKINKYVPGTNIKIISSKSIKKTKMYCCICLEYV